MIKAIFKQPFLGAFFLGFSLPMPSGNSIFSSPFMDLLVFMPLGIILLTISYHLAHKKP